METQSYIQQIDALKKMLESLPPANAEQQEKLWKKFRLEWNYNSNHIEGNTLSYGQTELLLIFDKATGEKELREYEEMKAHDLAIKMVVEEAKDKERPLTENFIRLLNEKILVRPFWKEAETSDGQKTRREIQIGQYKSMPNSVRLSNGEMFHYASPQETPALMHDLVEWYNSQKDFHPVTLAAMFHYRFVRIHPFDDGNGRVARLLMNYILLKYDYPPVIIKSDDKANYLLALNKADTGDLEAFADYIAAQMIWSLDISIKAAKGESIEEVEDIDKEIDLLKRGVISQKRPNKSPKLVFDTYLYVQSQWWNALYQSLATFDDLFNESKVTRYFNNYEEEFETKTKNILTSPFLIEESTRPKSLKIFGHDLYKTEVNEIEWREKKYSLRGAPKIIDYQIKLRLDLGIGDYSVKIFINNKEVYGIKNHYTVKASDSDIKEMIMKIKKYLHNEITKILN